MGRKQKVRIPEFQGQGAGAAVGNGAEEDASAPFPSSQHSQYSWKSHFAGKRIPIRGSPHLAPSFLAHSKPVSSTRSGISPPYPAFGKPKLIPAGYQCLGIPVLPHPSGDPIPGVPIRDTHGLITSALRNPQGASRREQRRMAHSVTEQVDPSRRSVFPGLCPILSSRSQWNLGRSRSLP